MSFFMRHLDSYCVRVVSLNVGTVTRRGRELGGYDGNDKGWVECCVCKRLEGRGTTRNSWGGCKLLRSGANEQEWMVWGEYYPKNWRMTWSVWAGRMIQWWVSSLDEKRWWLTQCNEMYMLGHAPFWINQSEAWIHDRSWLIGLH